MTRESRSARKGMGLFYVRSLDGVFAVSGPDGEHCGLCVEATYINVNGEYEVAFRVRVRG